MKFHTAAGCSNYMQKFFNGKTRKIHKSYRIKKAEKVHEFPSNIKTAFILLHNLHHALIAKKKSILYIYLFFVDFFVFLSIETHMYVSTRQHITLRTGDLKERKIKLMFVDLYRAYKEQCHHYIILECL